MKTITILIISTIISFGLTSCFTEDVKPKDITPAISVPGANLDSTHTTLTGINTLTGTVTGFKLPLSQFIGNTYASLLIIEDSAYTYLMVRKNLVNDSTYFIFISSYLGTTDINGKDTIRVYNSNIRIVAFGGDSISNFSINVKKYAVSPDIETETGKPNLVTVSYKPDVEKVRHSNDTIKITKEAAISWLGQNFTQISNGDKVLSFVEANVPNLKYDTEGFINWCKKQYTWQNDPTNTGGLSYLLPTK